MRIAEGERLLFTKNDKRMGVKNGTTGTLEKATGGRLIVVLDGEKPRRVEVDLATYRNLNYGYALTVHKAQGVTVDTAHVLAGRTMDRHSAYVAMSRHRDGMTLHYGRDDIKNIDAAGRILSRNRPKESTLDYFAGERGRARTLQEERAQAKLSFRRSFAEASRSKDSDTGKSWMQKKQMTRKTGRSL